MNLILQGLFAVILIALHPDVTAAAKLVFHTNEPVIHMVLTKQLQLRCSISTPDSITSNPSTAVSANSDIAHVISIIITKTSNVSGQSEPVASISQFEPASPDGTPSQNLFVEGNTTENAGTKELGYLQVTWNGPTDAQAANYTCEITALTSNKHVVELKGHLNITASEPGIADLIRFIIEHERLINELQVVNRELVNRTEELRASLSDSNQLIKNSDIESLISNMSRYGSDLSWIKARLNSTVLDSGLVVCSNQTRVYFHRSFTQTPNVLVSIASPVFDSHSQVDFGIEVYVLSVGLREFTAYCKVTGPVYQTNVAWLAITAHLTFESSPTIIYPVVTKQLRLRCSVQPSSATTTAVTTTPTTVPRNTTNPGVIVVINSNNAKAQDLVASDGDVSHVMSIIIAKKDNATGQSVNVASVTAYDMATAEGPFSGTLRVEGSSEKSPLTGELGYLELIWDGPAEEQAGTYTCEIFGLNPDKHSMYLRTSKEVITSEPTIASLVNFIIQHDITIQQLQASNDDLRKEEARLRANLTADHSTTLREAELMRANLTTWQRELDAIVDQVDHPVIQTGKDECINSTRVEFRHYFSSNPDVLVSVSDAEFNPILSYWPYYEDFGFQVYVQSVDRFGFSAYCKKKGSNSFANFTWLAIERIFGN